MWSTGDRNGKPLQYSCLENPTNSMKRQKDRTLEDKHPWFIGVQNTTGEDQINSFRKKAGPKRKQRSAVDVSGGESKVQCSKEQCIYRILFLDKCAVWAWSLSGVQLFATPWTVTHQAPLSMEFSRPECWSGLPFHSPGNLPNPGIEPESPASPALRVGSLLLNHQESPGWLNKFI